MLFAVAVVDGCGTDLPGLAGPEADPLCSLDPDLLIASLPPDAIPALQLLKKAGYKLILASNQSGIARGMMTEDDLASLHTQMQDELTRAGVALDAIYYCPHGWDDGCLCRKPGPGMLFQAQRDFNLDLTKTLFIGDDERDEEAGVAAGCRTALVSDQRSLLDVVRAHISRESVSKEKATKS